MKKIDRFKVRFKPLRERKNKVSIIRDAVQPAGIMPEQTDTDMVCREAASNILKSISSGNAVMLAFGAHTIKNGLGPVLKEMMKNGWLTHLATNGAGIIHDWEIAFQGATSEDVARNIIKGEFGTWEETGYYINLALTVGAFEGLGYGESVGAMISKDGLNIPEEGELLACADNNRLTHPEQAAAALDLLQSIRSLSLKPGFMKIEHPYREYSVQAAAFDLGIGFTGHPMFGHDIIYTHPASSGAAIGRTAERDFLEFAGSVENLENGVYLSVGSAVMSPMIFEKSLSMARNIALGEGKKITNFNIYVVDLAPSSWDWENGSEPPADDPAYYLRYCKTFSRMGGKMKYVTSDNRVFLPELYRQLLMASQG